jgi:hypothetical protein
MKKSDKRHFGHQVVVNKKKRMKGFGNYADRRQDLFM